MSGMGEQYAELDDALTRRRGVPELEDLLSVWERLDRLDAGLPHVPDPGRRQQLTQARAERSVRRRLPRGSAGLKLLRREPTAFGRESLFAAAGFQLAVRSMVVNPAG
ncbi:hypothetical protein ACWDUL_03670 [Nocardia niigatensis]